jgi:hypothetical protein
LVATRKRQPAHPIQGVLLLMKKSQGFHNPKSPDLLQTSGH